MFVIQGLVLHVDRTHYYLHAWMKLKVEQTEITPTSTIYVTLCRKSYATMVSWKSHWIKMPFIQSSLPFTKYESHGQVLENGTLTCHGGRGVTDKVNMKSLWFFIATKRIEGNIRQDNIVITLLVARNRGRGSEKGGEERRGTKEEDRGKYREIEGTWTLCRYIVKLLIKQNGSRNLGKQNRRGSTR